MRKEKIDIRSVAYAFIANDINVYLPDNEQECFIIEYLSCKKCHVKWHTSLLECYFCGEINYYLYKCNTCNKKYSITSTSKKCCGETLVKACINEDCASNTKSYIIPIANKEKGVFDLKSSFNLSLMHCVKCAATENYYQSFKVFVFNDKIETNFGTYYNRIKNDLSENDIVIFKKHNTKLLYDFIEYKSTTTIKLPSKYRFVSITDLIANILK